MKAITILLISIFISSCSYIEIKKDVINKNINNEIKIIQISDLHLKKNKGIYKNLIKIINSIKPDILLITGDSVDKSDNLYLLDDFLEKLKPDIIKYSILGNWEYWSLINLSELNTIYATNNVKLLVNKSELIQIKNETFYIFGTDDLTAGKPDIKNIDIDKININIIMTHSPEYFDLISEKLPDDEIMVFSGHTHGGQITLFGKPLYLPEGSGNYIKGIYKKNKLQLFVSKGIGNSIYDFRLFACPDIFLIIIK